MAGRSLVVCLRGGVSQLCSCKASAISCAQNVFAKLLITSLKLIHRLRRVAVARNEEASGREVCPTEYIRMLSILLCCTCVTSRK